MKTESITTDDFGDRLKAIRRAKGLTQYQLADLMNTTQRMIAHYEKKGNRPRIDKVKALANVLNIPVEELIGTDSTNKKNKTQREDPSFSIAKRANVISKLPIRDQKAIFRLINSLVEKNNINPQK